MNLKSQKVQGGYISAGFKYLSKSTSLNNILSIYFYAYEFICPCIGELTESNFQTLDITNTFIAIIWKNLIASLL